MADDQLERAVSEIGNAGRVTAQDVLRIRRIIYGEQILTQRQIDHLFAINRACAEQSPEWRELFNEALVDFLVHQQEPHGYVDDADADWLIERVASNGRSETELNAVITVMEKARKSPERLVQFALQAVRELVLKGSGPAGMGDRHRPGVVTEADVDLLRRILYAHGGDQHLGITRAEAEVLFDINDATAEAENHPSWSDLFVKAVANSVLFFSGYSVPTRQESLRREQWLNEPASVGSFLSRLGQGLANNLSGYRAPAGTAQHSSTLENQMAVSCAVTDDEAQWLSVRMGRDGRMHENEKAVLAFLRENATSLHPSLQAILQGEPAVVP
jgi:hypothetical protein